MSICCCFSDYKSNTYTFIPDVRKIQKSIRKMNISCHPTTESEPLLTFGYYPSSVLNIFWSFFWPLVDYLLLEIHFPLDLIAHFRFSSHLLGFSFSVSISKSSIFFPSPSFSSPYSLPFVKCHYPLRLLCTLFSTDSILFP